MLVHIFSVYREQIHPHIRSIVKPCEMIDTQHIDMDIFSLYVLKPILFLQNTFEYLLCAEHFMAASKCFDPGKV